MQVAGRWQFHRTPPECVMQVNIKLLGGEKFFKKIIFSKNLKYAPEHRLAVF